MSLELLGILIGFAGTIIGYVASHLTSSGRAKERAAAEKAMKDNYEERISSLHESIDKLNTTERKQAERIEELNAMVAEKDRRVAEIERDKTARIREVEDRLAETERENTRLAEENGALKEDMASHRCVIKPCGGRIPQNEHTRTALANGTATYPQEPVKSEELRVESGEEPVGEPVKKRAARKSRAK